MAQVWFLEFVYLVNKYIGYVEREVGQPIFINCGHQVDPSRLEQIPIMAYEADGEYYKLAENCIGNEIEIMGDVCPDEVNHDLFGERFSRIMVRLEDMLDSAFKLGSIGDTKQFVEMDYSFIFRMDIGSEIVALPGSFDGLFLKPANNSIDIEKEPAYICIDKVFNAVDAGGPSTGVFHGALGIIELLNGEAMHALEFQDLWFAGLNYYGVAAVGIHLQKCLGYCFAISFANLMGGSNNMTVFLDQVYADADVFFIVPLSEFYYPKRRSPMQLQVPTEYKLKFVGALQFF